MQIGVVRDKFLRDRILRRIIIGEAFVMGAVPRAAFSVCVMMLENLHGRDRSRLPLAEADAFRVENLDHGGFEFRRGNVEPEFLRAEIDDVGEIDRLAVGRFEGALEAGDVGQFVCHVVRHFVAARVVFGKTFELRADERRHEFMRAVVPAEGGQFVGRALRVDWDFAEVAHPAGELVGVFAVRDEEAAFAAGEVLGAVAAEAGGRLHGADVFAVDGGAMGLAAVADDGDAVLFRDRDDAFQIGGHAVDVDGHDGLRAGRDGRFQQIRIKAERVFVDIDEHGNGVLMEDDGGGRPVGEGGQDDFVTGADSQRGEGHVEGARSAIDDEAVLYADEIGEFLLQGLALGGEDAVEDVGVENGQDGVAVSLGEGRPCLDEAVRNSFFAAEDCESFHGSFLFYMIDDEWLSVDICHMAVLVI